MELSQKHRLRQKLEIALIEVRPWCDPEDAGPTDARVPPRFRAELYEWIFAYDHILAMEFSELCDQISKPLAADFGDLFDFIDRTIGRVTSEIDLVEGSLADAPLANSSMFKRGFLDSIHPRIAAAAQTLFHDGHHAEAVSAAAKMLIQLVRESSGKTDLEGTTLMDVVFSPKDPVLSFNNRRTQTEKDEQEGMYFLYKGAVLGVRNPRAHDFLEDSPERALEYIGLISLLANRLEETNTKRAESPE